MKKNSYSYEELINCGEGKLFGQKSLTVWPLPAENFAGVPAPVKGHLLSSLALKDLFLKFSVLIYFPLI